MNDQQILFQVGDQVIHWAHGPGVITQLDEKSLSGRTQLYYEVQMSNLTLWVPVEQTDGRNLRLPTLKKDFNDLFDILSSSGDPLSLEHNERRLQLVERLKNHELASICEVIRDLTMHKSKNKLDNNDMVTLKRGINNLVNEWSVVFSIPILQAEKELRRLLDGNLPVS